MLDGSNDAKTDPRLNTYETYESSVDFETDLINKMIFGEEYEPFEDSPQVFSESGFMKAFEHSINILNIMINENSWNRNLMVSMVEDCVLDRLLAYSDKITTRNKIKIKYEIESLVSKCSEYNSLAERFINSIRLDN